MSPRHLLVPVALLSLVLTGRGEFAASAEAAQPLPAGRRAPAAAVQTPAGESVDLAALTAGRPTLLVFYRGGWCPYCTKHLAALQEVEAELTRLGYQIIAISPEPAAALAGVAEKHGLAYRLLSDPGAAAAQAFGLAYRVDPATQKKYAGYGISLRSIPGEPEARWLPVPAVFVVGPDGIIRFAFANPDYKTRLATDRLLAEARRAAGR